MSIQNQLKKMPSLLSAICHLGKSLQEHHISLKDICRSLRNDKAQQLVVAHKWVVSAYH